MPCTLSIAVSGETNFAMHHTGLTVGGFIQPSIARNLIEILSNVPLSAIFVACSTTNCRRLTKNSLPPLVHIMYIHEVCNIL